MLVLKAEALQIVQKRPYLKIHNVNLWQKQELQRDSILQCLDSDTDV